MGYLEESVEERRRRRGRALNVQDTGDRHGGGGRQTERERLKRGRYRVGRNQREQEVVLPLHKM